MHGTDGAPRVAVTQGDRGAAANVWRDYIARTGEIIVERQMRAGALDDGLPAIFARHRLAAEAATLARIEQSACDHTAPLVDRLREVEWSGKQSGKPVERGTTCWARNPDGAEAAERIQRLEAALRGIFAKLDDGPDAPGHSHDAAGIWDADNSPDIAGKPCEWCAHWSRARAALSASTAAVGEREVR